MGHVFIGPETAAILIEPIQAEGGVRVAPPQMLKALRALCDQQGLLLLLEVVTSPLVFGSRNHALQIGFCQALELLSDPPLAFA